VAGLPADAGRAKASPVVGRAAEGEPRHALTESPPAGAPLVPLYGRRRRVVHRMASGRGPCGVA